MLPEQSNTLKLKNSPIRWILLLLGSAAFISIGVIALIKGDSAAWVWVCIIFFGLGIPISILSLLPNANYLLLTPEGFTMKSLFRSMFYKWFDVKGFSVNQLPNISVIAMWLGIGKMITFDFNDTYTGQQTARSIARGVTGYDAALESGYGMKLDDLCNLMNQWKGKYGVTSSTPTITPTVSTPTISQV